MGGPGEWECTSIIRPSHDEPGEIRKLHTPNPSTGAAFRGNSLETPVFIGFQADGFLKILVPGQRQLFLREGALNGGTDDE